MFCSHAHYKKESLCFNPRPFLSSYSIPAAIILIINHNYKKESPASTLEHFFLHLQFHNHKDSLVQTADKDEREREERNFLSLSLYPPTLSSLRLFFSLFFICGWHFSSINGPLITLLRSAARKGFHQASRGSSLLANNLTMVARLQTTISSSEPFIWSSVSRVACRFL